MLLHRKNLEPSTILRLGFVFLILASLGRYFLRPSAGLSEGVADGVHGFLYGVTIATLLLGLWMNRRRGMAKRD